MLNKYLKFPLMIAMLVMPLVTLSSIELADNEGNLSEYLSEEELYQLFNYNLPLLESIFDKGANNIQVAVEYEDNLYLSGLVVHTESLPFQDTISLWGRTVEVGSLGNQDKFRVYIGFETLDNEGRKMLMYHLFGRRPAVSTEKDVIHPNELHVPRIDIFYREKDILRLLQQIKEELPADVSELFVPPLEND